VAGYRFKRYPPITPHAAAKIIAAYNYQACETPDYDETPATHAVAAFAPLLPVYSGANERPEFARIPWGIDDESAARKCFANQTPPAITATIAKMADFAREGQAGQTRA
jgi:hypothetical protein